MIAQTYYDKALANFKTAKIVFSIASNDEEQLNVVAYHLQQSLELAIKHVLLSNGVEIQKTHDIDQLILYAKKNNIDLYLPEYLVEHAESISLWETKTRYVLGYILDINKVNLVIENLDEYFKKLSKTLTF